MVLGLTGRVGPRVLRALEVLSGVSPRPPSWALFLSLPSFLPIFLPNPSNSASTLLTLNIC